LCDKKQPFIKGKRSVLFSKLSAFLLLLLKAVPLLLSSSNWLAPTICRLRIHPFSCNLLASETVLLFFSFFIFAPVGSCLDLSIRLLLGSVNDQEKTFHMTKIKFLVFSTWCRGHDGRSETRKQLVVLLTGTRTQSFVTLYQKPLVTCNKLGAPAWGLMLGWQ